MDDFELGLSSGSIFKDDFYESFQAPKFYDFINPRESGNADEWFRRGLDCGIKEIVLQTVESDRTSCFASSKKAPLCKNKNPALDGNNNAAEPRPESACSENEDPNQGPVKLTKTVDASSKQEAIGKFNGKKTLQQKSSAENSPIGQASRAARCVAKVPPATVPQKKVLATRKAALGIKRLPAASKSLLESFREDRKNLATSAGSQSGHESSEDHKDDTRLEGEREVVTGKNYTSDSQESFELPRCKRAIGQDKYSEAAEYVVEQAEMLESAIKLLSLGDEERNAKVCTELIGAVCADGKLGAAQSKTSDLAKALETKQTFSFTALRKENSQQGSRKRKSKELITRIKRENCSKTVAGCLSPLSLSKMADSKKPRVTCPQPFRLRTEERGALKEIEFNKKMEHYIALKEGLCSSAPAVSNATIQPKVVAIPMERRALKQQTKIDRRSPVEVSIEMVTKDLARQQLDHPQKDIDRKRKLTRPHPMPCFNRPFKPQRSTKKLTVPIEPKFHAIHAGRTCTRHCHAVQ